MTCIELTLQNIKERFKLEAHTIWSNLSIKGLTLSLRSLSLSPGSSELQMTPKFEIFGLKKVLRSPSCRKQWLGCDSIVVNSLPNKKELNFSTGIKNRRRISVWFRSTLMRPCSNLNVATSLENKLE